jgi:hypothetical protein
MNKAIGLFLVLSLAVILGACGGGGTDTTAPAESPSPAASPSP